jgi:hypothetical protein
MEAKTKVKQKKIIAKGEQVQRTYLKDDMKRLQTLSTIERGVFPGKGLIRTYKTTKQKEKIFV